jgi:hypothetical protein
MAMSERGTEQEREAQYRDALADLVHAIEISNEAEQLSYLEANAFGRAKKLLAQSPSNLVQPTAPHLQQKVNRIKNLITYHVSSMEEVWDLHALVDTLLPATAPEGSTMREMTPEERADVNRFTRGTYKAAGSTRQAPEDK